MPQTLTILMLEDEPLVAFSLLNLVSEIEPTATVLGPLSSVKEAQEWFNTHPSPDLVLADIQLADGISLDVFANRPLDCPIIFTTAYNEYAIRAFKLNSIDYLLKPIEKEDLKTALEKYHLLQAKFENKTYLLQMQELFANFNPGAKKYKTRFSVHQGRSMALIPAEEIVCFGKEEYIYLLNTDGKKYISDFRSLDEVAELLDPTQFFRANRQYLVALTAIEGFRSDEWGKLKLKLKVSPGGEVTVSREKAGEFRRWVEK
ncbi:MAG TPA: LytTR family DNA-binding domain-containing protein [Haliscomenobacter sp.]|uniref:LytR/AlgR family response regulator transcription factor n=1 Tax=Haliscomenobacter sp. TaxID=2717303 RepID=UPI002D032923|nr:LytTR family DNA-binding domain-containing protein [Haliscomenobacter sp.]HOY17205.1 LytTR family DNA-binding domain-containing protein [Haliscomenobacter sp.]HPH18331.1 LytTR family DNA-binding domain-containing protein [Haliscomenobacter sp.]